MARSLFGTALCAAALVATQGSAQSSDVNALSHDQLLAAAQAEGGLTIYCGPINTNELIAKTFEEKFGVPVEFLRLPSTAIMQRYSAEATSGAIVADILWCAGMSKSFVTEGLAKEWLQPIEVANLSSIENVPDHFQIKYDDVLVSSINMLQAWGYSYNTTLMSKDDLPKTILELAGPDYKGKINMVDARSGGSYQQLWNHLLAKYGEDFIRAVGENRAQLADSNNTSAQGVAAGEQPIGFPSAETAPARVAAQGAPISWVRPEDTMLYETRLLMSSASKTPHPAAARLFANWILSEEGTALATSNPADGLISIYDPSKAPATFEVPADPTPENGEKISALLGLN